MKIDVSNGEIIDKLTILSLKKKYIDDPDKLRNIEKEYVILKEASEEMGVTEDTPLFQKMLAVNEKLWDIEDKIRDCERDKKFEKEFIELARSVYITNDERSRIKQEINKATGSDLTEEKSYKEY